MSGSNLVAIAGDRPFPFDAANPYKGNGGVSLRSNGLVVNLDLRNFRHAIRPVEGAVAWDGITLKGLTVANVYRLLETNQSGQTLTNLLLEDISVDGYERAVARLFNVFGGVFRNVRGKNSQAGDPFPVGLHLEGNCHNILFEDCVMEDAHGPTSGSDYANGDGFADEGNCDGVTFRRCTARNNGDGGFDVKSGPTFEGINTASGNHRNWRGWIKGFTATNAKLVSISPGAQDFWTKGGPIDAPCVLELGAIDVSGTPFDAYNGIFRAEDDYTVVNLNQPYEIKDRAGFLLKNNSKITVNALAGGYYTGANGVRTFYPGLPPTGTGGVLL